MVRIQLSSLGEFATSLSRLDYEAAKVACGKMMEDHLRMGALMFSLLTVETMYTSMDYLTPGSIRRGNEYLLEMYMPLPRQLSGLLQKLVAEYEEEHQRLISQRVQPTPRGSDAHSFHSVTPHGSEPTPDAQRRRADRAGHAPSAFAARGHYTGAADAGRGVPEAGAGQESYAVPASVSHWAAEQTGQQQPGGSTPPAGISIMQPVAAHHSALPQAGIDPADHFDPNQYLANMEEAERVLEELEMVREYLSFIIKFVEVRWTMLVLYRFAAVTGPVLHLRKLSVMLDRCTAILRTVESSPSYDSLLEYVQREVWLVRALVDWDVHITAYDFVQSVTQMKRAKALLKEWLGASHPGGSSGGLASRQSTGGNSIYESIGDALSGRRDRDGADSAGQGSGHGLLYTALAKSSRMVQSLLGRGGGSSSGNAAQGSETGALRAVAAWISSWVDHLTFKTTVYFQQIIAPHRLLHHGGVATQTGQAAAMSDIWSRATMAKTNLSELVTNFLHANDGFFVALLFESSERHPFSADGFAVAGTRARVSDYRVQACAVLLCYTNQKLLLSRGVSVKESSIHDVHSTRRDPADRDAAEAQQQSDVEWFRQNCLPDILGTLDDNRAMLDLELLGSSPLLSKLEADDDYLLAEICDSVNDMLEEAEAELAMAKDPSDAQPGAGRAAGSTRAAEPLVEPAESRFGQMPSAFKLSVLKTNLATERQQQRQQQQQQQHVPDATTHDDEDFSAMAVPMFGAVADGLVGAARQPPPLHGPDLRNEGSLSLYSTYLQKSHLRNDVQQSAPAPGRGDSGGSVRHHGAQRAEHGRPARADGSAGDRARAASGQQHWAKRERCLSEMGVSAAAKGRAVAISAGTHDPAPGEAAGPSTAPRADRAAQADPGDEASQNKRTTIGQSYTHGHLRTPSAAEYDVRLRHGRRGTAGTFSDASKRQSRVSLSLRSLFWSVAQPVNHPHTTLLASPDSPECEVARRVRCGEMLTELFGAWCDNSEDMPESITTPHGGGNRPVSIHSLSFHAPARASTSTRVGAGTSALAADMPDASGYSSRQVLRPPRSSAQPRPPVMQRRGSRPLATPRVGEYASAMAVERTQYPSRQPPPPPRGQRPEPLQPPSLLPLPRDASSASQRPTTPTAAGGTEGYTYLYSRVGLPNIALVAVLLDTDKGLDRRREAEHAWGGIVDVFRGAALFDQLTTQPC